MRWFGNAGGASEHRLGQSELFRDLSARDLRVVDAFLHERHILANEVIFDAGEEGLALYVILQGKVGICLPGQSESPIATLQPGHFFGEMGLLDDSPRSAQARALEPTVLVALSRTDYERLMASHARIASVIALQLARHLGLRLRQMLAGGAARSVQS